MRPGAQALDRGRQPDGQREAPCVGLQVIRELIAAGITCALPARAMPGKALNARVVNNDSEA